MHLTVMGALLVTAGVAIENVGLAKERYSSAAILLPIAPLQLAQNTPTLTERVDQIDTCRGTAAAITIYKNSALNDAIGTVSANSSITLTGIFGAGVVQIKAPQLGWVATNTLVINCGAPPDGTLPGDIDTSPRYCRRLRSPEVDGSDYGDLSTGLVARNTANGDFQYIGSSNQTDGPTKGAIVRFPGGATDLEDAGGRRWIRIKYRSSTGASRVGWVPNGPTGVNRNIAACSSGQN
ncbi:MAG: hypothetical protein KME42_17925 [Tildeniella nuda ZEHNDER 1965/U140]|nr:hypothetical protein [Tildeniella nuda ZEHNDER 1965/U140]